MAEHKIQSSDGDLTLSLRATPKACVPPLDACSLLSIARCKTVHAPRSCCRCAASAVGNASPVLSPCFPLSPPRSADCALQCLRSLFASPPPSLPPSRCALQSGINHCRSRSDFMSRSCGGWMHHKQCLSEHRRVWHSVCRRSKQSGAPPPSS